MLTLWNMLNVTKWQSGVVAIIRNIRFWYILICVLSLQKKSFGNRVFYKHIRKEWHVVGWHVTWDKVSILSLVYRVT